jgi:hypothetical protein
MASPEVSHVQPGLVDIDDVLGLVIKTEKCHCKALPQHQTFLAVAVHADLLYLLVLETKQL